MNDQVRETLADLIKKYGTSLVDDPRRLEGLLRDLCGESKREINALIGTLKLRVPADLLNTSNVPLETLSARLIKRVEDDLGLKEELARWTVESWAAALGKKLPQGISYEDKQALPAQEKMEPPKWGENRKTTVTLNDGGVPVPFSWKSVFIYFFRIALILGLIGSGFAFIPIRHWLWTYDLLANKVETAITFTLAELYMYFVYYIIVIFGFKYIYKNFTGRRIAMELGTFLLSASVIGTFNIIYELSSFRYRLDILSSILFGLLICYRIKNFSPWGGLIIIFMDYVLCNWLGFNWLREHFHHSYIIAVEDAISCFIVIFLIVLIGGLLTKHRLQIRDGWGKQNFINLGWLPVRISNDKDRCDFWVESPTLVMVRFYRKNKQYYVKDEIGNTERQTQSGDQMRIGNATVIVR